MLTPLDLMQLVHDHVPVLLSVGLNLGFDTVGAARQH